MNVHELQPLSQARLQSMNSKEIERAEAAIIRHVLQIAEKHCAEAGVELKIEKRETSYWFSFGSDLRVALLPHTNMLKDETHLAFLRGLFAEVFDLLVFAYDGAPAYTIHELSRAFGAGISTGPILPLLLPGRARPILEKVREIAEAEHEEEMRRQDQSGY